MGSKKRSLKRKFAFDEVVIVKPQSGILDISDISCLDDMFYKEHEQHLLIGKKGVISGMSHRCSLDHLECEETYDQEEHATEFLYGVDIDIKNADELEPGICSFTFRETDLESTGEFRPRTDLTGETIRVRVDPETGEGDLVNEEDWKKLEG